MKKRHGIQLQEDVSPNLIPMIDIMFLLLLFFMLGADMGQRELEEVFLPFADAIDEDKPELAKGRLTINVFHDLPQGVECPIYDAAAEVEEGEISSAVCRDDSHWKIGIMGKHYQDQALVDYLKEQAQTELDPNDPKKSLKRVQIRGDKGAPFGLVQRAIEACALAGIFKIEVGAAQPPA
jgi:biopolymer transport protein ExbD